MTGHGLFSYHGDGEEEQVAQIQKIRQNEWFSAILPSRGDGFLQLLRDIGQRESQVCKEGDDGYQPRTGVEVRSWHHVVIVWGNESRSPVTPHYAVGLLVRMPNAQGHTQPIATRSTDTRRIIDKLQQTVIH